MRLGRRLFRGEPEMKGGERHRDSLCAESAGLLRGSSSRRFGSDADCTVGEAERAMNGSCA